MTATIEVKRTNDHAESNSPAVFATEEGSGWTVYHGDSCEIITGIPPEYVGYSIYSPPFASLYVYSDSPRDMGNAANYNEFSAHYRFLIREILRITKPGRLSSVHCMNLPTTKQHHGQIGIQDFRGDIIRDHVDDEAADFHRAMMRIEERRESARIDSDIKRIVRCDETMDRMREELREHPGRNGWIYHSEVCIWKDPVTAMQRTKAIGLLHKQLVKDSCMSRQGIADYLVAFRKPGVNAEPVEGELDHFVGDQSTFKSEGRLSIDIWQRYASPVWMDINPSNTLQKNSARDESDERHIAPLQIDVIERGLQLWSNPGDVVFSPFGGIGSEPATAVENERKAIAIELKKSYFKQLVANCRVAEEKAKETRLFV